MAVMTAVYTAYLFAQARARDLWQSPLLPPHMAVQGMLGGVVAHEVEIRVSHIGLEAECFGHADGFEEVEHVLPRMHAAPADFPLGREPLAVILRDRAGLPERSRDPLRVPCRGSFRRARATRVPDPGATGNASLGARR